MAIFRHKKINYNGTSKVIRRLCEFVNDTIEHGTDGDMSTSVYDINGDGIVDNAEQVNGHNVYKDVPADAVFTDTIYDSTLIEARVASLMNDVKLIIDTLFAPEYSWLLDSDGNVIVDSNNVPIYTVKLNSAIIALQEQIAELQSRKYIYYADPQTQNSEEG